MRARSIFRYAVVTALSVVSTASLVRAQPPGDPAAVSSEDGELRDKNGDPTFNVAPDGTVDWYSNSGYLRYTGNCMQCHGPDGLGSSLAPSLTDALKQMDYSGFVSIVVNGKQDVNAAQDLVMPAFGTNRNVMCYIDPIYVYLPRDRTAQLAGVGQRNSRRSRRHSHRPRMPVWSR